MSDREDVCIKPCRLSEPMLKLLSCIIQRSLPPHCKKDIRKEEKRIHDESVTAHIENMMLINKTMPYPGIYLPSLNKETHHGMNVKTEGGDF